MLKIGLLLHLKKYLLNYSHEDFHMSFEGEYKYFTNVLFLVWKCMS